MLSIALCEEPLGLHHKETKVTCWLKAQALAKLEQAAALVFVTSQKEYAIAAFQVNAANYLQKQIRNYAIGLSS